MEADQKTKTSEYLKGIVANLPEGPGIYQYLNAEGVIIYVGKAKNESISQQNSRYTLYCSQFRGRRSFIRKQPDKKIQASI